MNAGFITKVTAAAVLLLAGCQRGPRPAVAIGEAYVGPAILKIRADIPTQSAVVATVKHGDRLEILQRRRLFLKVRTANGAIGWTDDRQLLAGADMAALRELAERASRLPSQGQAFSFREMSLHTLPSAQAPSFATIAPNDKVTVLAHMRTPRTDLPRRPLIPPAPKKVKVVKPGTAKPPKYPPVPMPKPPGPPPNWLDLSKTDVSEEEADAPAEEAPAPKAVPTDDWSLVRTPEGQSGWVLTRRLVMAIPDEVAQYAEGKRIVSYFPLSTVMDGDEKKPTWLWTTAVSGPQPYDFESFRVFVWNAHRHRYETAFIARNIHGFSPVLVHDVEYAATVRNSGTPGKYPGFSVCLENDDGQRVRREFALLSNVVRFAGEQPCEAPAAPLAVLDSGPGKSVTAPPAASPPSKGEGLGERLKQRLRDMTKGWFGS